MASPRCSVAPSPLTTALTAAALALAPALAACDDEATSTSSSGSTSTGTSTSSTGGGGAPPSCGSATTTADLDGGAWDARFTIAGFTDHDGIAPRVNDFAMDPSGGLLAVGRFRDFEGERVTPFMRLDASGWAPARATWELPLPLDGFQAIAVGESGALALATAAASFPGAPKAGEIWLEKSPGGLEVIGKFDGQVRTIAWRGGDLWVAGAFALEGVAASNLAVWNGTTWSAPPGGAANGPVYDLAVVPTPTGARIHVAGAFSSVGGVAAKNAATFDGAAWTARDLPEALAIFAIGETAAGDLYAGGALGGFRTPSGLAKWDGSAWQTVGGGLGQFQTRGVVSDLATHGDVVDVAGCFSTAGGFEGAPGVVDARGVARWDGAKWIGLDDGKAGVGATWFSPAVCGDEGPDAIWDADRQRLAFAGDRLYLGGMSPGAGGVQSQSIIAHDGASWVAQGKSGLGVAGSIDRVAIGGSACDVFALGSFTHLGGSPVDARIARFDGGAWHTLATSLPADAWCPSIDVGPDGAPTIGCLSSADDGSPIGVVLHSDGASMVPIVTTDPLPSVFAVAYAPSGALFVGGSDSEGKGWVARVDDAKLTYLSQTFDGPVNQLDVRADDDIVVGGAFTTTGDVPAMNVARWNGTAWSPLGAGVPGQVSALRRDGETVYVSTYDLGAGAYLLGAFDGTAWTELASPAANLTPNPDSNFNQIRMVGDALVLVGSAVLDDGAGRGALVFQGGKFRALDGGVGGIGVSDVAIGDGAIWVAGSIAQAGPDASAVSTVGLAVHHAE